MQTQTSKPTRHDEPLVILVRHYGRQYATAYRAVVDQLPARNAAESHLRGDVAHYYAVNVCRADFEPASDLLTLAAYATAYAVSQTGWGAGNAKAASAYAAVCCDLVNA